MEVILAESIRNLGEEGDIVRVRPGYARNYLIPRGYAFTANTANAKELEHRKRIIMEQRKRKIKTEEDLAKRIAETELTFAMKAGEEDKLFGSITNKMIADALEAKGYKVDRHKIQIDEPIRTLGEHTVDVRFSAENSATLKVVVEKES